MNRQQWYYAHLRWAVMAEGKEGLRHWEEAVHIFLSDDRDAAFQRALEIGHQAEHSHDEGRRWVESRLAQVVKLDCLGADQTEFQVVLGSSRATERLPLRDRWAACDSRRGERQCGTAASRRTEIRPSDPKAGRAISE